MAAGIVRAVAYYRMSTAQQEASIPEQRAWGERTAKANAVQVVAQFQDDAIAGDVRERPGLADLLAYCEANAGEVQAVVVWDGDRLSRADSIKTAVFLDRLISAGVTRLLTQEGWVDFDSDLDRLMYNIRQDMGRLAYSKSLSKNVARSGLRRAREGRWVCGRPPYGYAVGDDGHLAIGEKCRADTIRSIFRQYVNTAASLGDLARRLNEAGTPSPSRSPWSRGAVRTILLNPAYCGDVVWNVRTRAKHHRPVPVAAGEIVAINRASRRRSKQPQLNDPADRVIVEDAHPALVDRETFAAARAKLAAAAQGRGRRTPIAGGGPFVLSGMLHCAHCRHRLIGVRGTIVQKGRRYTYVTYECCGNKRHGAGTCYTNRVHQDAVVREVAEVVKTTFSNADRLRHLRDQLEEYHREHVSDGTAERERLTGRLADLDRQLDLAAERLLTCPAEVQARAAAKLKEWQADRDQTARELSRLNAATEAGDRFTERAGEALYALQTLGECLADATPEQARNVLSAVLSKVTLHFDHSQTYRGGRRTKTQLRELEIEIESGVAELLGIPAQIRSLVGDWKKYPIGNRTFEEIDKTRGGTPVAR
jgi:DNA invertase Pin-like site-specific DNA recombinase